MKIVTGKYTLAFNPDSEYQLVVTSQDNDLIMQIMEVLEIDKIMEHDTSRDMTPNLVLLALEPIYFFGCNAPKGSTSYAKAMSALTVIRTVYPSYEVPF